MQFLDETDYLKQTGIFRKVMDECRISKMSKQEMKDYEKSVLEYEDVKIAIAYAKELAIEEGVAKGREEGLKEGIEKGMEKGMEKGRMEGIEQAKFSIVRNMLEKGVDIPTISSLTKLEEVEIKRIAAN